MFGEIVEEIVEFTDLPRDEVGRRVWMEAVDLGWNVSRDAARFSVVANKYSDEMIQLYREGDGFIFETLVFWSKPDRQCWSKHAVDRVRFYASRAGLKPHAVKILILGDGTGNDSLFLIAQGFSVDYFDVPGSKTFDFAVKRFEHYGVLNRCINVLSDYNSCLSRRYDVVISFEVLEHLPQPLAAIRDINSMLKDGGIALVTEAFEFVSSKFPTHLETNAKYAGRTPFLFLKNGMMLTWYSREPKLKPMEFVAVQKRPSIKTLLNLLADRNIRNSWLMPKMRRLKSLSKRLL